MTTITVCLLILTTISVAVALAYTKSILIPFLLALSIAYIAAPSISWLQRHAKLPRWAAMVTVSLCSLLLLAGLGLMVSSAVKSLVLQADVYQSKLLQFTQQIFHLAEGFGIDTSLMSKDNALQAIQKLPIFSYVQQAAGVVVKSLSDTLLVMVFVAFLLSGRSFSLPNYGIWPEVDKRIRQYLLVKISLSTVTAVLTGLILGVFGLEMASLFAMLAFILNFIPNIGPVIATLLPLPIALLQYDSATTVALVIALPGLVQFIVGNVSEPKLLGDSLDLHPVTQILTLMFWGLIWGIPGMLLATPITVIMKIFLENTPRGRFLAEMLAGRFNPS